MEQVKAALQTIVDNADAPALNYAVNYAKYGLTIEDSEEMRGQVLRVLGNITHWRGETAKQVRATLKAFVKN